MKFRKFSKTFRSRESWDFPIQPAKGIQIILFIIREISFAYLATMPIVVIGPLAILPARWNGGYGGGGGGAGGGLRCCRRF